MTRLLFGLGSLALTAGCAGSGGGSPPAPQVTLTLPVADVIGSQLTVQLTTSGCATVTSLTLLNHGLSLKALPTGQSPLTTSLATTEIPFDAGIPAVLALSAKLTCSDGRSATTPETKASFFPAAAVYTNANGSPYVPDVFYAEGSGGAVTFVGCALDSANNDELVRVDLTGAITQYNDNLQTLPCDDTTYFTNKASDGSRWAVSPNAMAFSYGPNLAYLNTALYDGGASPAPLAPFFLTAGSDGDAVALGPDPGGDPLSAWAYRVPHTGGAVSGTCKPDSWCAKVGIPQTAPVMDPNGNAALLLVQKNKDAGTAVFSVARFKYTTGALSSTHNLLSITYGELGPQTSALSLDAGVAFISYDNASTGSFTVKALSTIATNPPALWTDAALTGTPLAVAPSSDGSYVTAITSQGVWFLDAKTGANIGRNQQALVPSSPLSTVAIQAGLHKDFYILNGAAGQLPSEIVVTDDPSSGELFRYWVADPNGVSLAFDDSGQLWLRLGNALVQTLPLAQYRALRGP